MLRFDRESAVQATLRGLCDWLLTERQIIVRSKGRTRFIPLSRIMQAGLGALAIAGGGWFVYSTVSYFDLRHTVVTQKTVIARSESAYDTLVEEMAHSRDRISSLVKVLGATHKELLGMAGESAQLETQEGAPKNETSGSESGGVRTATSDPAVDEAVSRLEGKAADVETRHRQMEGTLEKPEHRASAEPAGQSSDSSRPERLDHRVIRLARRLAQVRQSQNRLLNRIARSTMENIEQAESAIVLTGLDPQVLLERIGASDYGQGGPFVPVNPHDLRPESFDTGLQALNRQIEHWQDLQKVLRQLPLTAPLDDYWISGKFGRRRDPFNHRWAEHRGLDMAGRWHADVFATAPGRVRRAGRWGSYGRFVEIDHGMGIRTRYGHMRKIVVKRGQSVDYRQKIGEQGSTGRAKSAHLHYEILVNGRQVNPIKFIKAGEHVFEE